MVHRKQRYMMYVFTKSNLLKVLQQTVSMKAYNSAKRKEEEEKVY